MFPHRRRTAVSIAVALLCALGLSACGGVEGVSLEGKVFDLMGISGSALEGRTSEPKLADRAPLVVPPSTAKLPEPGSGKTTSEDVAALADPEQRKKTAAADRERLHLAYCRGEIQWKERALDPNAVGANRSPYGPCPGLFSADKLTK
jgi:hypothetical protein